MTRTRLILVLLLVLVTVGQRPAFGEESLFNMQTLKDRAVQGDADAQFRHGLRYYAGLGMPQDYVEAMKWFLLAANQEHADAMFHLGEMYENSRGISESGQSYSERYIQAHMWYNLAAAKGTGEVQRKAENRRVVLERLSFKISPDGIIKAQQLAREWKPTIPEKPGK